MKCVWCRNRIWPWQSRRAWWWLTYGDGRKYEHTKCYASRKAEILRFIRNQPNDTSLLRKEKP